MNNYIINDGRTNYVRISKHKAKRLWGQKRIAMCPVNLRPGYPFCFHCEYPTVEGVTYPEEFSFDDAVDEFAYYNCVDNETGTYPAFYVMNYTH